MILGRRARKWWSSAENNHERSSTLAKEVDLTHEHARTLSHAALVMTIWVQIADSLVQREKSCLILIFRSTQKHVQQHVARARLCPIFDLTGSEEFLDSMLRAKFQLLILTWEAG